MLLQVLVAGQHLDSQAVVFAVAAIAAFSVSRLAGQPVAGVSSGTPRQGAGGEQGPGREHGSGTEHWSGTGHGQGSHRGPGRQLGTALPAATAGVLIGLGFAVKVTMSLAGAGIGAACLLVWLARRRRAATSPERNARSEPLVAACWLAAGFAVTAAAGLAVWGISALKPGLSEGSYVSNGSPWRSVRVLLALGLGTSGAEDVVKLGAIAFGVFLLVRLLRSVDDWPDGWPALRGRTTGTGRASRPGWLAGHVPVLNLVVWVTFAVVFAWLFCWPYVLPWYDAIGWALIVLLPWSALDWLLLARTAALGFGYLTGAVGTVPPGLAWLEPVVRTGLVQVVLLICVIMLILVTRRARPAAAMRS